MRPVQRSISAARPSRNSIAGTPMSAVKMPTGSCCGAHAVRAAVSAIVSSAPPSSTESGEERAVLRDAGEAYRVRRHQADEADRAAEQDGA